MRHFWFISVKEDHRFCRQWDPLPGNSVRLLWVRPLSQAVGSDRQQTTDYTDSPCSGQLCRLLDCVVLPAVRLRCAAQIDGIAVAVNSDGILAGSFCIDSSVGSDD